MELTKIFASIGKLGKRLLYRKLRVSLKVFCYIITRFQSQEFQEHRQLSTKFGRRTQRRTA